MAPEPQVFKRMKDLYSTGVNIYLLQFGKTLGVRILCLLYSVMLHPAHSCLF